MSTSDFRIAVLDRAAEVWGEPGAAALFVKMVSLKLAGYWAAYDRGALPVDTSDFFSTHVLVGPETGSGDAARPDYKIIMGFRMTTLAQCRRHNAVFPPLALANSAGAPEHAAVVQEHIDRCDRDGLSLAYAGSWTMQPDVKEGRGELRDLTAAALVFLHETLGVDESIVGGTLRFKTDRLFTAWGYQPIESADGPLPPVNVAHLQGENVLLMHVSEFSDEAIKAADRWRDRWDARWVMAPLDAPPA